MTQPIFFLEINPQSKEQGKLWTTQWILWQPHITLAHVLNTCQSDQHSWAIVHCLPLTFFCLQYYTLIGFWRQSVLLLDVMCTWTSQWTHPLWRENFSYTTIINITLFSLLLLFLKHFPLFPSLKFLMNTWFKPLFVLKVHGYLLLKGWTSRVYHLLDLN